MIKSLLADLPPAITGLMGYSRFVGAAIIILVGVVAARIVQGIIKGLLLRLASKTQSKIDEQILHVLHRPIWLTMLLISAGLAILWLNPPERAEFILVGLIESLIVLVWLVAGLRLTSVSFEAVGQRMTAAGQASADLVPLLANLTRVLLVVGAIMAFLAVWDINITPLLASAGIAGVAVALAAKDTLANFFGGISVFVDRPYKIGDYINLDSGERGEVVDIGIRSTRIQTRDDVQIIIPNAAIASSRIVNESAPEPKFRARIKVGVAYGSDLDLVERLMLETAAQNEGVVSEPAPRVRFRSFGDSGLDFELLCWLADPRDRGRVIHELNKAIYNSFHKNGVVIPFPQLDLHVVPDDKH